MENMTIDPKTVSDPIALRGEMRRGLAAIRATEPEILWPLNQRIHRLGSSSARSLASRSTCCGTVARARSETVWYPVRSAEIPPRVEYAITSRAKVLNPLWTRSSLGVASMEVLHRRTAAFDGLEMTRVSTPRGPSAARGKTLFVDEPSLENRRVDWFHCARLKHSLREARFPAMDGPWCAPQGREKSLRRSQSGPRCDADAPDAPAR